MGFGILTLGYLMCINLLTWEFLAPASALMFLALSKLSYLNRGFGSAKYVLIATFTIGIAADLAFILPICGVALPYEAVIDRVISVAANAAMLVYLMLLFSGIRSIFLEVGLPKNAAKAVRQQIYSCLYYLPIIVMTLVGMKSSMARYIYLIFVLLGYVVYVLNLMQIFSCYRLICMPSDLDMARKESKFAFVNQMREKEAQRQKRRAEFKARANENIAEAKKQKQETRKKKK